MSDIDLSEFDALSPAGSSSGACGMGVILAGKPWRGATLTLEELTQFAHAVAQRKPGSGQYRYSRRTLSKWLRNHGVELGDSAIGNHRAGECLCGKP